MEAQGGGDSAALCRSRMVCHSHFAQTSLLMVSNENKRHWRYAKAHIELRLGIWVRSVSIGSAARVSVTY